MSEKKIGNSAEKNALTGKQKMRRRLYYAMTATVLIAADIVSKLWAAKVLQPAGTMPLIDGVIGLRFARNFGAAFSSFSGSTLLLSIFSMFVCSAVGWYLMKNVQMHPLEGISLTMIFSGGVGNLIDRMTRGYVVDFFEFQFVEFAVFNVADILITSGAVLLFIALMRGGNEG